MLASPWDITPKEGVAPGGESWPEPPQVWPITDCIGDKCKPLFEVADTPINGVTVGGVNGFGFTGTSVTEPVNVVGYGGQYRATLQFFGTADKNAGPINNVIVSWGDGKQNGGDNPGRYKNHLGLDACNNSDFAHSTNACTEDYFSFTHTYICNEDSKPDDCVDPNNPGPNGCFARDSCPENVNGAISGNGSCCVFKPRVQLKDNWGWCNGDCAGTGRGCYEGACNISDETMSHWTYFAGKVIVVPK